MIPIRDEQHTAGVDVHLNHLAEEPFGIDDRLPDLNARVSALVDQYLMGAHRRHDPDDLGNENLVREPGTAAEQLPEILVLLQQVPVLQRDLGEFQNLPLEQLVLLEQRCAGRENVAELVSHEIGRFRHVVKRSEQGTEYLARASHERGGEIQGDQDQRYEDEPGEQEASARFSNKQRFDGLSLPIRSTADPRCQPCP